MSLGIPFLELLIIRPFIFKGKNNSSLLPMAVSFLPSRKQCLLGVKEALNPTSFMNLFECLLGAKHQRNSMNTMEGVSAPYT